MLAVGAVAAATGWFMHRPAPEPMPEVDPEALAEALIAESRLAMHDPFSVPAFSSRGGGGDNPPPYLNQDGELGQVNLRGQGKREWDIMESDPPLPGYFMGINPTTLADEMRERVLASSEQALHVGNNALEGFAEGGEMVPPPDPMQAHLDSRDMPVTTLTEPKWVHETGPESRMPNPDGALLGVSNNGAMRGHGGADHIVRMPERAIPTLMRAGMATYGQSGNADVANPTVRGDDPTAYIRQRHAYSQDTTARMPGAAGPFTEMRKEPVGWRAPPEDKIYKDGVGNPQGFVMNNPFVMASGDAHKQPLLPETENRVSGPSAGGSVHNPNVSVSVAGSGDRVGFLDPVAGGVQNRIAGGDASWASHQHIIAPSDYAATHDHDTRRGARGSIGELEQVPEDAFEVGAVQGGRNPFWVPGLVPLERAETTTVGA